MPAADSSTGQSVYWPQGTASIPPGLLRPERPVTLDMRPMSDRVLPRLEAMVNRCEHIITAEGSRSAQLMESFDETVAYLYR